MCFTGKGKGKTTAALGAMMRAYGRGLKVIMLQFIKKEGVEFGEHISARKLGFEIIPLGAGFTWKSKDIEKDRITSLKCWEMCKDKILNSDYDLIVLDEITYPIKYNWLDINEVLDTLQNKPKWMHIILTGRDAHEKLLSKCDLVTEMLEVNHHFKNGIRQQIGIEK
ncbi:cob(I)yrinic acid a,c-diamide adenosyltransferase [Candidatus Poribacteria bacterium]|nr:cob(I)yrinic acid a,c-diamide adenosyltransferase [Candidatus Poribacteria bacterium]